MIRNMRELITARRSSTNTAEITTPPGESSPRRRSSGAMPIPAWRNWCGLLLQLRGADVPDHAVLVHVPDHDLDQLVPAGHVELHGFERGLVFLFEPLVCHQQPDPVLLIVAFVLHHSHGEIPDPVQS